MISIEAKDVPPLTLADLAQLQGRCGVENFSRMLLAAAKTDGPTAAAVRSGVLKLIPMLHHVALAQLEDLLPPEIVDLLRKQDFDDCALWLMSDGARNFGALLEGSHALIGTREEIARILSLGVMRSAQPTRSKGRPNLRIVK
jgi:hypothetical protein